MLVGIYKYDVAYFIYRFLPENPSMEKIWVRPKKRPPQGNWDLGSPQIHARGFDNIYG